MLPIIAILLTIIISNIPLQKIVKVDCVTVFGKKYKLNINLYYLFLVLPLYCISAFQFATQNDYYNYSKFFAAIQQGSRSIKEPVIFYIFKIVADLHLDFQFVYIFIYIIAFWILVKALKRYSESVCYSLILYVTLFYPLALFQIRQLLAVLISFYALRYIEEKKPFQYFLFIVLACGCHMSAIIMFPAYFLLRYKYRLTDLFLIAGFLTGFGILVEKLLPILINRFFPSRVGWYVNYRSGSINKWELILQAIVCAFVYIYYKDLLRKKYSRMFINSIFIYLLIIFTCRWVPEVTRWGYYYLFPLIALMPNCLNNEKNRNVKSLYGLIFLTYAIFYYFIQYIQYAKQLNVNFLFWM